MQTRPLFRSSSSHAGDKSHRISTRNRKSTQSFKTECPVIESCQPVPSHPPSFEQNSVLCYPREARPASWPALTEPHQMVQPQCFWRSLRPRLRPHQRAFDSFIVTYPIARIIWFQACSHRDNHLLLFWPKSGRQTVPCGCNVQHDVDVKDSECCMRFPVQSTTMNGTASSHHHNRTSTMKSLHVMLWSVQCNWHESEWCRFKSRLLLLPRPGKSINIVCWYPIARPRV